MMLGCPILSDAYSGHLVHIAARSLHCKDMFFSLQLVRNLGSLTDFVAVLRQYNVFLPSPSAWHLPSNCLSIFDLEDIFPFI